jgi:hypothetical protein
MGMYERLRMRTVVLPLSFMLIINISIDIKPGISEKMNENLQFIYNKVAEQLHTRVTVEQQDLSSESILNRTCDDTFQVLTHFGCSVDR